MINKNTLKHKHIKTQTQEKNVNDKNLMINKSTLKHKHLKHKHKKKH